MSDPTLRPIVVKRIKKAAHEHHGGAWKIAYADFVTAMMAFFLLMWLLGSATKAQQRGIAEYFQTPLKVALFGGEGSGDASSLIKGGGEDLTKSVGQDNRPNTAKPDEQPARGMSPGREAAPQPERQIETAEAAFERRETEQLDQLKKAVTDAIDTDPLLAQHSHQILLDIVGEGLRVQIVDEQNRPMFASGSARLEPYTAAILHQLGRLLNQVPNKISLAGHTDARPYAGGERGYSNWELSADRANASRRELLAGGMDEDKIMRVVGLGSAVPLIASDPLDPANRRISIVVMKRKAARALLNDEAPPPVPAVEASGAPATSPPAGSAVHGVSPPPPDVTPPIVPTPNAGPQPPTAATASASKG